MVGPFVGEARRPCSHDDLVQCFHGPWSLHYRRRAFSEKQHCSADVVAKQHCSTVLVKPYYSERMLQHCIAGVVATQHCSTVLLGCPRGQTFCQTVARAILGRYIDMCALHQHVQQAEAYIQSRVSSTCAHCMPMPHK